MSTLDNFDQGVEIAALTDPPNAERLARDIVNALVPKMVMTFQSANERNATITAPVGGMAAWLETEGLLTVYDSRNAQWTVVTAGAQAWSQVHLVTEWRHNGNSQGNFMYRIVNTWGEKTLYFKGGIEREAPYPSNPPSKFHLNETKLPLEARPPAGQLRTISVPCSDVGSDRIALKMDLDAEGELYMYGITETNTPAWIGFNGCYTSL